MDDRFRTLLERSMEDARDVYMNRDIQYDQELINQLAMNLFQYRCQKWLINYQMEKQQEMMSGGPDTDPNIGMQ